MLKQDFHEKQNVYCMAFLGTWFFSAYNFSAYNFSKIFPEEKDHQILRQGVTTPILAKRDRMNRLLQQSILEWSLLTHT